MSHVTILSHCHHHVVSFLQAFLPIILVQANLRFDLSKQFFFLSGSCADSDSDSECNQRFAPSCKAICLFIYEVTSSL